MLLTRRINQWHWHTQTKPKIMKTERLPKPSGPLRSMSNIVWVFADPMFKICSAFIGFKSEERRAGVAHD